MHDFWKVIALRGGYEGGLFLGSVIKAVELYEKRQLERAAFSNHR
ncbi:hypothetical protein MARINOS108_11617 [Marinoscillum sp. 108]|nr:hypothetical protein MARINOS108_11617 [Marinoscillum sp. 108]